MLENKVATIFDLVESLGKPSKVLTAMGLSSNKVYLKQPKHCKACGREGFAQLTLLGIHKKPLFFECDYCGTLYLRKKREWVEDQFKKIKGLYTNINDWYEPSRDDFD